MAEEELLFKQLRIVSDDTKKNQLEKILPKGSELKMIIPSKNGLKQFLYSINPINESEKEKIEEKLDSMGINQYYFQG